MRESRIEKLLINEVKKLNGLCFKCSSVGFNGLPDRMVLYQGKLYFVELKAPGEKPRKIQLHVHNLIRQQGFEVRIIDSLEDVEAFVKEIGGDHYEV